MKLLQRRLGRFASVALLMAGFAHASVHLPNGEYRESVDDIKVKVLGGFVTVSRTWQADNLNKGQFRWYLNPAWADLAFEVDVVDGAPTKITRAGADFVRSGNGVYVFDKQYFIQQTSGASGWRWYDRLGNWITYDADGKINAYGDRNDIAVHFVRDPSSGRIATITDNSNRTILTYTYDGDQVSAIADYTGRAVHYTWANAQLTDVVDVLGYSWHYAYLAGLLHTKTDPEGRITTIDYSGNRVVRITDPPDVDTSGNPVTYVTTYDYAYDRGKSQYTVVKKTPGNMQTTTRYDADGHVVHREIGTRVIKDMLHDGPNIDIAVDERGLRTRIEYDSYRNPIQVTYPDGSVVKTTYDGTYNLPLTQTDELGVKSLYEYDTRGRLLRHTEAVGLTEQRVTEYSYDPTTGQRLTETVHGATPDEDATTTWTYDDYGNVHTMKDAENHVTTYQYDAQGNVTRTTDAHLKDWITGTNAAGWIVSQQDPLNPETVIEYDKVGNRTSIEDAEHRTTRYSYTTHNLLRTVTDPLGGIATYEYSKDDRPIRETDPSGVVTEVGYDTDNRFTTITDGAGNVTTLVYGRACDNDVMAGQEGLLTATHYPTYCEEYTYDQRGHRTKVTRVLPGTNGQEAQRLTTLYAFDAVGHAVGVTDPLARTTQSAYDGLSRLVTTIDALGGNTTYAYDARDNLKTLTDANHHAISFTYDKVDQVKTEARPLGQTITYDYDEVGNLTTRTNPMGERQVYGYDDARQCTSEALYPANSQTPSQNISYTYDGRGLLTGYVQTGDTASSATYVYDEKGQQRDETVSYGTGASAFTKTLHYEYEPNGQKKKLVYPDGSEQVSSYDHSKLATITIRDTAIQYQSYNWQVASKVAMPGVVRTLSYDGMERPLEIRSQTIGTGTSDAPNGPIVMDYKYQYDAAGNVAQRTTEDGDYVYTYDALNRIAGAVPPSALQQSASNPSGLPIEQYTYDAAHNRLSSAHQPGPWAYDSNDRLSNYGIGPDQQTYTYDLNGSVIHQKTGDPSAPTRARDLVYNAVERLTEIDDNGGVTAKYQYDPLGRRIRKETNEGVTWFQYSDEGLIAEYGADGALRRTYGWIPDNTWGTEPLWLADVSGSAWSMNVYHSDKLGTPQRLTGPAGTLTWEASSEAFGKQSVSVAQVRNPISLPGQYSDSESDNSYNYLRDYQSVTGRYLESDPLPTQTRASLYLARSTGLDALELDTGSNPYAYVNGNPISEMDAYGDCPWCVAAVLGGLTDLGWQLLFNGFRLRCVDWWEVGGSAVLAATGVGIGQRFGTVFRGRPNRPTYRFFKRQGVLRVESHPIRNWFPDSWSYPHWHVDRFGKQFSKRHLPIVEPTITAGAVPYNAMKDGCDCDSSGGGLAAGGGGSDGW